MNFYKPITTTDKYNQKLLTEIATACHNQGKRVVMVIAIPENQAISQGADANTFTDGWSDEMIQQFLAGIATALQQQRHAPLTKFKIES
jgi:hypothetical protein